MAAAAPGGPSPQPGVAAAALEAPAGKPELDPRWRWTTEELESAPWFRKGAVTVAGFMAMQVEAYGLISKISDDSGLSKEHPRESTRVCDSAIVLWQRFHASKMITEKSTPAVPLSEYKFLAASAFLAMSKALELPVRVDPIVDVLLRVSGVLDRKPEAGGDPDKARAARHAARRAAYEQFRDRLLRAERKLLHVTAYDTVVELPRPVRVRNVTRAIGADRAVVDRTLRQMYSRTRLALQLSHRQLTEAAAFFAARYKRVRLPVRSDPPLEPWWTVVRLSWAELDLTCRAMLQSMVASRVLPAEQLPVALQGIERLARPVLDVRDAGGDVVAAAEAVDAVAEAEGRAVAAAGRHKAAAAAAARAEAADKAAAEAKAEVAAAALAAAKAAFDTAMTAAETACRAAMARQPPPPVPASASAAESAAPAATAAAGSGPAAPPPPLGPVASSEAPLPSPVVPAVAPLPSPVVPAAAPLAPPATTATEAATGANVAPSATAATAATGANVAPSATAATAAAPAKASDPAVASPGKRPRDDGGGGRGVADADGAKRPAPAAAADTA